VALEDIRRPYAHGVGVSRVVGYGDCHHVALPLSARNRRVRRTLRISCEAVPPPVWPAGAQGGTSACRTGAALSFVSFIRLFAGFMRCVRVSAVQPLLWAPPSGW
jgi:hypothetical protein